MGIELGAYYKPSAWFFFDGIDQARQLTASSNPKSGHERFGTYKGMYYLLYPKLYYSGLKANSGPYVGLKGSYSHYTVDVATSNVRGAQARKAASFSSYLMIGSRQNFAGRITFGVETGLGYYHDTYIDVTFADRINGGFGPGYSKNINLSGFNFTFDMVWGILF